MDDKTHSVKNKTIAFKLLNKVSGKDNQFSSILYKFVYTLGEEIEVPEIGAYCSMAGDGIASGGYGDTLAAFEVSDEFKSEKMFNHESVKCFKKVKLIMVGLREVYEAFKNILNIHADNEFLLHQSAIAGDLEMMKMIIDKGVDINKHKDSCLVLAVRYDQIEVANFLFDKGANLNGDKTNEAIYLAAKNGYLEMVKLLIDQGVNINVDFAYGCFDEWNYYSIISGAAESGNAKLVELLIEAGSKDMFGSIGAAASIGNIEIVKIILEKGLKQNSERQKILKHALYIGACNGHLDVVKLLAKNYTDEREAFSIALAAATCSNKIEMAKLALSNGAYMTACYKLHYELNGVYSPFDIAAEKGSIELVKLLIDNGIDVNAGIGYCNDRGFAFRLAVRSGNLEMVKLFLENGADPHLRDDFALCMAAMGGHIPMIKFLLDLGLNDNSCLWGAVCNGHTEALDFLIKKGLDVNFKNGLALRVAYNKMSAQAIKSLLTAGAKLFNEHGNAQVFHFDEQPNRAEWLKNNPEVAEIIDKYNKTIVGEKD